jgi:phytoene/squalene synthetase
MELYTAISRELSQHLTQRYSTSFTMSSRLFSRSIRKDIYAIYGAVRIADEIVDTYIGNDRQQLLKSFEAEIYAAIQRQYSTNPIIHAFAITARRWGITKDLIAPFFVSMRMDITPSEYSPQKYQQYIHGSAEVIGLMCLRVFCQGDAQRYTDLAPGAAALGSAYQKINFLRDVAADFTELHRVYFPGVTFEKMNEADKQLIIASIHEDFAVAIPAIEQLPTTARAAVATSLSYYSELLQRLETTPIEVIKRQRIRVPNHRKLWLLARTAIRHKVLSS